MVPFQILLCLQMLQQLWNCVHVKGFNYVQWKQFQIKECAYFRYITISYIGDNTELERKFSFVFHLLYFGSTLKSWSIL